MFTSSNFTRCIAYVVVITYIIFSPRIAFPASENKNVSVRLILHGDFKIPIEYLTIFNDGSLKIFIPDNGNGMYKDLKVSKNLIDELITKLKLTRITDSSFLKGRNYFGIGAKAVFIEVYIDDERYYLGTWHPFLEIGDSIVVSEMGENVLKMNETKEEFLKNKTSENYYRFRKVWAQCYTLLDDFYYKLTGYNIDLTREGGLKGEILK